MQRITGLTAILVGLGVSLCSAMTPLITGGERILFVGNNMTGYAPPGVGGLDVAVRSVLASGSVNVTTECVALPGTGELSDVYAQGVATERIRNGDYDFVVLQGWLQPENYYDGARDAFVQSVRQFHQVIVSSGAKTMLYMTYPNVFQAFRPDVANYETVMNVTAQDDIQGDYLPTWFDLRGMEFNIMPAPAEAGKEIKLFYNALPEEITSATDEVTYHDYFMDQWPNLHVFGMAEYAADSVGGYAAAKNFRDRFNEEVARLTMSNRRFWMQGTKIRLQNWDEFVTKQRYLFPQFGGIYRTQETI